MLTWTCSTAWSAAWPCRPPAAQGPALAQPQHPARFADIAAHYDLGNQLFEQFLDPTMMYSAAMFPHDGASPEHAQLHKLERICHKLGISPGSPAGNRHGLGSMAIYAASHYGCRVTTTTLSREAVRQTPSNCEQGLQDRITLLLV